MLSRKFDYMSSAPPSMGSTEPVRKGLVRAKRTALACSAGTPTRLAGARNAKSANIRSRPSGVTRGRGAPAEDQGRARVGGLDRYRAANAGSGADYHDS